MNRLREQAFPLLLLVLGFALHFIGIGHPGDVVWDEYHFVTYAQSYLDRAYSFDIHPPLGKLLIAGCLAAAGAPSPVAFEMGAGDPFPPDYPYIAARFLPAVAGSLLPVLIYFTARALSFSKRGALLAGGCVLLENALLAISRLAMIDIFLHAFTFAAYLAFLHHRRAEPFTRRWWALLALTGVLAGCAVSIKWPGIGALGVIGVASLIEAVERRNWRIPVARMALLGLIAAAVYVGTFAIHFQRLTKDGQGTPFMTPEFRATLEGTLESERPELPRLGTVGRFLELNQKMYSVNVEIAMTHESASRWPQWLTGRKPIPFWKDESDPARRIVLAGNPVVWAFSTLALAGGLWMIAARRRQLRHLMNEDPAWRDKVAALEFLLMIWLVHVLPFASITRAMFLYHYFTAYLAAILLGAFVLVELSPVVGWRGDLRRGESRPRWVWALLGAALLAMLVVLPVTYGFRPIAEWQSLLLPK